ncbi:MAG: hypothetical protein Q8N78_07690 [Sulfurimonas sp.]|nr:hypothetical protein [Sulfurimonas sp.]
MQAAYNLNSNELNINFLNSIKEMFQNRNIEIIITDNVDEEYQREQAILDETLNDYRENGNKNFTLMTDEFCKDTALNNILDYISEDSINQALMFNSELHKRIKDIPHMPYKCRKSIRYDDDNIREKSGTLIHMPT